jgi:hypothetical protein
MEDKQSLWIVPDVTVPSSNDVEYLSRELEPQVQLLDSGTGAHAWNPSTFLYRILRAGTKIKTFLFLMPITYETISIAR